MLRGHVSEFVDIIGMGFESHAAKR
jgi:hypothetical protein